MHKGKSKILSSKGQGQLLMDKYNLQSVNPLDVGNWIITTALLE